jgi:ribonuclease HI
MALKLVLMLAQEYGITHIQIFGDSLLVIQWMRKESILRNFTLQPLFYDVQSLQEGFSHISFSHIYRDIGTGWWMAYPKRTRNGRCLENYRKQRWAYISDFMHDPWV